MPRVYKPLPNAAAEAKKQAKLALQREKRAEAKAFRKLGRENATPETPDYDKLIVAEARRMGGNEGAAAQALKNGSKASPKSITAARENLTAAFEAMGGVPALVVWGRENRTEFYRIWARLIPRDAVEPAAALPLEELLSKLANKAELSVADAAFQIGNEILDDARAKVAIEDLIPHKRDMN